MMDCRTIFLVLTITLVVLFYDPAVAAPNVCFSSCSRPEDQQYFSPLSYLASKAMGAVVKCASLACQLLPLPDFIKPSKPTLKIGKSEMQNRVHHGIDYFEDD